jgi:site-specific DNA recombinase
VSPETWAAARDLLADPVRRSNPGAVPKTLLSGIATCGVCGCGMKAGVVRGIPSYRCAETPHLSRKRADADHFVTHIILERLSRPDAAELLRRDDAPDVDRLRGELLEAQQAEEGVLSLVGRGLTSVDKAAATLRDVRERIGRLEAALSDAGRVDVFGDLVAEGDAAGGDRDARWNAVAEAWAGLDVDRQRAIVRKLLAIEMRSPGKGSRPPKDAAGRLAHTEATLGLAWH